MTSEDVAARVALARRLVDTLENAESGTQWTALALVVGGLLNERPPSTREKTMGVFNNLVMATAHGMDPIPQERAGNGSKNRSDIA